MRAHFLQNERRQRLVLVFLELAKYTRFPSHLACNHCWLSMDGTQGSARPVETMLLKLANNVSALKKLVDALGGPKDTVEHRHRISSTNNAIQVGGRFWSFCLVINVFCWSWLDGALHGLRAALAQQPVVQLFAGAHAL